MTIMGKKKTKTIAVYSANDRYPLAVKSLELSRDGANITVLGVFPKCDAKYAASTEQLYQYSSLLGAKMAVLYSETPALSIVERVKHEKARNVVISRNDKNGTARLIREILPEVNVIEVDENSDVVFNLLGMGLMQSALIN